MMSGYPAEAVSCAPKAGLSCLHCDRFLREPVQTEEGLRVCKACFAEIKSFSGGTCSKCGVSSSGAYYPDKAVQREVLSLLVFCSHKQHGCQWQGPIKQWESHCSQCSYKASPCPNEGCSDMLPPNELELHLQECQYRLIPCQYCATKVLYSGLQSHSSVCLEVPITCEEKRCGATVIRKHLAEHSSFQCQVVTCPCSVKVDRSTGEELPLPPSECRGGPAPLGNSQSSSAAEPPSSRAVSAPDYPAATVKIHLSDSVQNFQHHQALAERVQRVEEGVACITEARDAISEGSKETVNQLKEENAMLKSELTELKSGLGDLSAVVQTLRADLANRDAPILNHTHLGELESLVRADSERTSTVQQLKKELVTLQGEVEGLKKKARHGLAMVQADGLSSLQGLGGKDVQRDCPSSLHSRDAVAIRNAARTSMTPATAKGDGGVASDSRLLAAEKRVEEIAKQLTVVKVHGQELELQLQASLASTHNGSFLWRIPDVSRRRRDAVDERVTSIYSPPFYTGRNGYKMCIRAYLNGDGMGYKTHLSLFFVLMKGECDPLLKWPFEYKVSMILVDQTHRKHIVQTFKPTPESTSFQQPTADMNVASGCPQFAKLTVFDDDSYINNDVMFIKCIVDTTKIFHP